MEERLIRTEMLLGAAAMGRLARAHVAVFGLGGVGSWCAAALAPAGEFPRLDWLEHRLVTELNASPEE